jgi:hypothetical protein
MKREQNEFNFLETSGWASTTAHLDIK